MSKILFSESLINKKMSGKAIPVIADIKCISPGEGRLIDIADAPSSAKMMEEAGAPAISVVTEPGDFGGSIDLLERITAEVSIPVLRKDFIRSKDEIDISIRCGASAVLLMCAVMNEKTMRMCYSYCLERGIEPLVETHTPEELAFAKELGAKLIGINNRNILQLEKDGGTVETISNMLEEVRKLKEEKPDVVLVSESGILTPEDVRTAVSCGADAALVGTAIWKAEDPAGYYKKLSFSE